MASEHYLSFPVKTPFDWEALLAFLRARATPGVEKVTDSAYVRAVGSAGESQTVSVSYERKESRLKVDVPADLK